MSKKEQLWHQRMGAALDARILTAGMLWVADNQHTVVDESDTDELDRRAEEEGRYARMEMLSEGNAGPAMTLGEAENLHQALYMALTEAGDKPLGIIEATSLAYLGHLLGCAPRAEFHYHVSAMFESGTITYTGPFEKIRDRVAVGVSFLNPENWLSDIPVEDVELKVGQVSNLAFEHGKDTGSDLKTVRVCGTVLFTVIVRGEDEPRLNAITDNVRVVIDPRQSPAPIQRVPMRFPILTGQEMN